MQEETPQEGDKALLAEKELSDDELWYATVYQGDQVPQLTARAVLMGGLLGALMSISNLYTMLKVGWAFGVAITSCVMSFVIWKVVRFCFPKVTPMSILENNCMQSTASSAGYSTGATVGIAFGALLMITGKHVSWTLVLPWTLTAALLGVFLAVPMKRQMINVEKLPFPSGIAAAETLRSLHAHSKEAGKQAYSLVITMGLGTLTGFLREAKLSFIDKCNLRLADFPFSCQVQGVQLGQFPGFAFPTSLLLIGAGMIVGLRVASSMLVGALLLYFCFAPQAVTIGEVTHPAKLLSQWSLWAGSAIMLTNGLTAFALDWKIVARAVFATFKKNSAGETNNQEDPLQAIEVPKSWLFAGLIPLGLLSILLQYLGFGISPLVGATTIFLSFFLALVACRATGETDITPMSAMCKITQITVACLAPKNVVTNLMAASVTANIASSSADLLTDLKSGYLLGVNPRKQFLAQLSGVFFGVAVIVPAWYLMVPDQAHLAAMQPPSVNVWKAVAEALSEGLDKIPLTARSYMLAGAILGSLLALIERFGPTKLRAYLPSAMGLGLSWVMPFSNSLAFFLGALFAYIWSKISKTTAQLYTVPVASGAVAGESLICAFIAIFEAAQALLHP
jgi:putative OPT family oligopeptide transporter